MELLARFVCIFIPRGNENQGSPPSSRRRQQSTGLLHLHYSNLPLRKDSRLLGGVCCYPVAVPCVRLGDETPALHTDRSHSLSSLTLPLAAVASLPKFSLASPVKSLAAPKQKSPSEWMGFCFGAASQI